MYTAVAVFCGRMRCQDGGGYHVSRYLSPASHLFLGRQLGLRHPCYHTYHSYLKINVLGSSKSPECELHERYGVLRTEYELVQFSHVISNSDASGVICGIWFLRTGQHPHLHCCQFLEASMKNHCELSRDSMENFCFIRI